MEKKIWLAAAVLALMGCLHAQAALTDGVAEILKSGRYLVTFTQQQSGQPWYDGKTWGVKGSIFKGQDHFTVPLIRETTMAADGDKELLYQVNKVPNSNTRDWVYYYSLSDTQLCYSWFNSSFSRANQMHSELPQAIDTNHQAHFKTLLVMDLGHRDQMLQSEFLNNVPVAQRALKECLLPLLLEKNIYHYADGRTGEMNRCTVYNGTGTQQIGNTLYQYEEFVTPEEVPQKEVTRFYFDGDRLAALIRMKMPYDEAAGENMSIHHEGEYAAFRFITFTGDVSKAAFEVDPKTEIRDVYGDLDKKKK